MSQPDIYIAQYLQNRKSITAFLFRVLQNMLSVFQKTVFNVIVLNAIVSRLNNGRTSLLQIKLDLNEQCKQI